MELAKGIAGKAATGVIVLAVGMAGLAWYQADPATRSAVINGVGKTVGWLLATLVLPWAGFAVIGAVAKMQSNAAGACLVAGLTIVEAAALLWLFDWSPGGGAAWAMAVAAVLLAGVYNTFACDWIAERIEG